MIGCHRSGSVWGSARLALALSLTTLVPAAQAATISTGFTSGGLIGDSFTQTTTYFNIAVLAPGGITITSFDVNVDTINPVSYSIYTKSGSYVGFVSNPPAWNLATTGTGTGAGFNNPTALTLNNPIVLAPGNHALAFFTGRGQAVLQGPRSVSNGDVSLALGLASVGFFSSFGFTTNDSWSGTITYDVTPLNGVPEPSTGLLVGLTALAAGAVGLAKRRRIA